MRLLRKIRVTNAKLNILIKILALSKIAQLQADQDLPSHLPKLTVKERFNQRSNQEVHGSSGEAVEINTSGWRICQEELICAMHTFSLYRSKNIAEGKLCSLHQTM